MGRVSGKKLPPLVSQLIAEFFGTFFILFFGTSVVAAKNLAGAAIGQWELSILWGLAVSWGVYLSAGISGGHLNPAVTITMAVLGKFPWSRVPAYVVAQYLGALIGAAFTYGIYKDIFLLYESQMGIDRGTVASLATAGVFSTYPHDAISFGQAFFVEVSITAVLLMAISAIGDDRNAFAKGPLAPFLIGAIVGCIGVTWGALTGFALNPARDFGPKCFAAMAGWGTVAFTGGRTVPYCFCPLIAPVIGAVIGGTLYTVLIEPNTDGAEKEEGLGNKLTSDGSTDV